MASSITGLNDNKVIRFGRFVSAPIPFNKSSHFIHTGFIITVCMCLCETLALSKVLHDLLHQPPADLHKTCYDGKVKPKKSMCNQTLVKSRVYFSRVKFAHKQ